MTGPSGNSQFCFPSTSTFPSALPRGALRVSGNETLFSLAPGQSLSAIVDIKHSVLPSTDADQQFVLEIYYEWTYSCCSWSPTAKCVSAPCILLSSVFHINFTSNLKQSVHPRGTCSTTELSLRSTTKELLVQPCCLVQKQTDCNKSLIIYCCSCLSCDWEFVTCLWYMSQLQWTKEGTDWISQRRKCNDLVTTPFSLISKKRSLGNWNL